jgi:hypothetical protein
MGATMRLAIGFDCDDHHEPDAECEIAHSSRSRLRFLRKMQARWCGVNTSFALMARREGLARSSMIREKRELAFFRK